MKPIVLLDLPYKIDTEYNYNDGIKGGIFGMEVFVTLSESVY